MGNYSRAGPCEHWHTKHLHKTLLVSRAVDHTLGGKTHRPDSLARIVCAIHGNDSWAPLVAQTRWRNSRALLVDATRGHEPRTRFAGVVRGRHSQARFVGMIRGLDSRARGTGSTRCNNARAWLLCGTLHTRTHRRGHDQLLEAGGSCLLAAACVRRWHIVARKRGWSDNRGVLH